MSQKARLVLVLLLCAALWLEFSFCLEDKITDKSEKQALSRRRKNRKQGRYLLPMIFATLLLKSVLFPLAFKAMATMSSVSIILSTLSLIVASIVGYVKLASHSTKAIPTIKYHHISTPDYHRRHDFGEKVKMENIFTEDS